MADPVDYPSALAGRVGFLLARAHLVARQKADAALARLGISAKGYAALATLVSDGSVSQQTLSRRLVLDPATMVDVIDSLESSGHLLRRRNPRDRREYSLQVTAKGRALFTRADRALTAVELETLHGLRPDEVQALTRMLARIAATPAAAATEDLISRALGR